MPRRLLVAAALLAALVTYPLSARTHVWKGTVSNLFSDPRNWSGGSPAGEPEAELVFPEAVRQSLVNDLDEVIVQRMTFEADGYTIEGKAIALIDGAEIESRDAVIAAELRLDGDVVQSPRGGFTRYSRDEGHATAPAIRSDAESSNVLVFDSWANRVDAHVTPGAETAWLILSRFFGGSSAGASVESDTDRDGVVRLQTGSGLHKVCVVDLTVGEIHAAMSDGTRVEPGPFEAKFLRDTDGNFAWIQVPTTKQGAIPSILWIRPGVGAWVRPSRFYGGEVAPGLEVLLFNVDAMSRVGASPPPPAGVEPGDYFISMSFTLGGNDTFYGARVDQALEDAERAATQVALNGSSMDERYGNAFFFVLRFGSTDRETRIEYEISDANADDGVAYPSKTGVFVLRRGEVFRRIEYPIAQDNVYTGGTSIRLDIRSFSGGTLVSSSSEVAALADDDPPPVVSVVSTSVTEGHAGQRDVPVELKRTGGTIIPTTVRWAVPTSPTQTIVFAPGETRKEIMLQVTGDAIPEPNEEIRIDLLSSLHATVNDGTLTVLDDDAVGITPRSVTVGEASGVAKVIVALDSPQSEPVTVEYGTAWEGTARPHEDYTPITGTLTFTPGEIEKRVVIPILQDRIIENPEFFEIVLFDSSPNVIIRQRGRVTIADDGDVPMYTMEDVTASEGEYAILFLEVSPDPQAVIHLGARIVPGSATAAVDYANEVEDDDPFFDRVSVSSGFAFLYTYVFADDVVEEDETFVIEVYELDNPSHVVAFATVTVEDTTSVMPVLTIGDGTAREGKTVSFPVTLSAPSPDLVKFRIRTVADTAESGVDFEPVMQLYTFKPGETSMTVEVPTIEDSLAEAHETLAVELLNPFRGRIADGIGRGRIFDDDNPEVPVFGVSNVSVSEGAGMARFTVTLGRALSRRTSISFGTRDGTAVAGEDYLASHGVITFEPGETSKTIEIALVNDSRYEEDETFTFRLANGPEATATIVNDDAKARSRSVRH